MTLLWREYLLFILLLMGNHSDTCFSGTLFSEESLIWLTHCVTVMLLTHRYDILLREMKPVNPISILIFIILSYHCFTLSVILSDMCQ